MWSLGWTVAVGGGLPPTRQRCHSRPLSRPVDSYRKNRSSSDWFAGTALRTPSTVQAARSTISQNSVNGQFQRRRPPRRGAARLHTASKQTLPLTRCDRLSLGSSVWFSPISFRTSRPCSRRYTASRHPPRRYRRSRFRSRLQGSTRCWAVLCTGGGEENRHNRRKQRDCLRSYYNCDYSMETTSSDTESNRDFTERAVRATPAARGRAGTRRTPRRRRESRRKSVAVHGRFRGRLRPGRRPTPSRT